MRWAAGILCVLSSVWATTSTADVAEERRLAERVVYAWPDPYSKPGLTRGARLALQHAFGDRMTPYAWREADLAYTPRVVPWSEFQPYMVDAFVEEFSESELNELVAAVSSSSFQKIAPHLEEIRSASSEAEAANIVWKYLSDDEISALDQQLSLMLRAQEPLIRVALEVGRQNAGEYRRRLMARCPNRTEPLPWCEN